MKYASRHAVYPVPSTVDISAVMDDERAVVIAERTFLVLDVMGVRTTDVALRADVLFFCVALRTVIGLVAVLTLVPVRAFVVD